ncbi:DNA-binding transcriptional regulator, MarR family [Arthrobacter alpinus]|uniref:DNA-binding transcriptional regulator, MarR family n=1 Tax=Arthrobacter alpinus TaxID=656366 RepID=A0A1H5N4F7_9MICC|nr:MarR family transcriptional regulator [Arthrobacter alpinus]SEE96413.1 DNA-binding transcriptional regulator, MarR family [Arthrobacter alpinus]
MSPLPPQGPMDEADMAEAIKNAQQQIGTMLVRARKSIAVRAATIHPDLKPMGFSAMMLLSRCGSMQQITLAQQLDTDKAVVSRLLKQLEELGLISRTVDPTDGRAMIVALTPEAHERYNSTQEGARQHLFDRLSRWELTEVRRFADLLARLNEDLD